ncbi:MAG: WhiB family transcriptional regulator [Pseudonocardia sp.]|nr:WhiB family transcriptional regulator [Pseudonocardia sp.]
MHGACRGMDSEIFFHPERERGAPYAAREARAKQVCRGCPVIMECRRHALEVQEPYGVWGGLSETERRAMFRISRRESRMRARLARVDAPGAGATGR